MNISGEISQICWNGTYGSVGAPDCSAAAVDDFEIAYYQANGADGRPGTLRAGPFLQSAGALTVSRVLTGIAILGQLEYQFHASHASVAVSANECLWVEITNLGTAACGWEWVSGIAGDNRNYVGAYSGPGAPYAAATQLPFDLSLCIGPAPLEIAPAGCGP